MLYIHKKFTCLMNKKMLLATLLLAIGSIVTYAQPGAEARQIVTRAVMLEDKGQMDSVLYLLNIADSIGPNTSEIVYEIGYYYFSKQKYPDAIKALERAKNLPRGRTDVLYQLLGNSYDYAGDSLMAMSTYKEGIKEFPKSGKLYLECGNLFLMKERYDEAVNYYEQGIDAEPTFPSNYYRAAQLWTSSSDPVWGIFYGEIFMNLERGSKRNEDVSKWLAATYRDNIKIHNKDSISVTLHKTVIFADNKTLKDLKKGKFQLPFGGAYEQTMILSVIGIDTLSFDGLCTLRNNFSDNWTKMGMDKKYSNVVLDYHEKLKKKGMLNAYNRWLMRESDFPAFRRWMNANKTEWDTFAEWFKDNPLEIDQRNKFLKSNEE